MLVLTAMIWGAAFVAQRSGMENVGPLTFFAARTVLAAAAINTVSLMLDKAGVRNRAKRSEAEEKVYRAISVKGGIFCGIFLAAASIFQQMGLKYTPAGKAGFITAMYMLLVPILHFLIFRKRKSVLVWLAVLSGVFGLYLLCITEGFRLTGGDSLECICALLFSFHILCCDHFAAQGDPVRISGIQFITAAVIGVLLAFIIEEPSWSSISTAVLPLLYCGLLSGALGHTLQIAAQKYTDPTVASLLMSLESVFAVIAGAILLGERMNARELAGCAVMFAAIVLVQITPPSKEPEK